MSVDSVVQRYWDGVAQRLQVEANVFNSIPMHRGEKGRANEQSLSHLVRQLLPVTVGVGAGTIINPADQQSKQMDLVVFDLGSQPQLLSQTSQFLFPIETVLAAIEVKTSVTNAAIADAGVKAQHLRSMTPEGAKAVHFSLFGYNVVNAPASAVRAIENLPEEQRLDAACVLRPAIFGSRASATPSGFVQLHRRDEDGQRVPGTYTEPEAEASNDGQYPETHLEAYGGEKILTEPGRALLLYCQELMRALSETGGVQYSWLAKYIPTPAGEVVHPSAVTAESGSTLRSS